MEYCYFTVNPFRPSSMRYYLDLFSPETYEAFSRSRRDISGFRARHESLAGRIKPGDKFICYMTDLSRWVGVLDVKSKPFKDDKPIFYETDDPFVIRFEVNPIIWLPKEKAIPIKHDRVWNTLSFTKGNPLNSSRWTGKLRSSLNEIDPEDGKFLERILTEQYSNGQIFAIDEKEYQKLLTHRVRGLNKAISVTVPEDDSQSEDTNRVEPEVRESIQIQALLAQLGAQMGMKIWIPKNDRAAVLAEWNTEPKPGDHGQLNFSPGTMKNPVG